MNPGVGREALYRFVIDPHEGNADNSSVTKDLPSPRPRCPHDPGQPVSPHFIPLHGAEEGNRGIER